MRPSPAQAPWLSGSLLIVGLTFLAYSPTLRNGFVWDDDANVTQNPALVNADGFRRIWLEPGACPHYYPLTFSSFYLERRLWGLEPVGYIIVNVLLHTANALLVWAVLSKDRIPGAWLAAALFALHPVGVESVAWITERKNTLSLGFALLSLLSYQAYRPPGEGDPTAQARRGRGRWYVLAIGFFVLALLSKSVTAMLAPVILLRDRWKRPPLRSRDLIAMAPFFVFGALLGLNTARFEAGLVGAIGPDYRLSLPERLLIAGDALWFYAGKIVAPINLIFVYPRWRVDPTRAREWLPLLGAGSTVAALFAIRRRIGKGPFVAVLSYTVMLFPTLGFLTVYYFRYSFVADHFQYHACVALVALIAAAATSSFPTAAREPRVAAVATLPVLVLLGCLTWSRCHVFHDSSSLWRDTLSKNGSAWIAHENLANILIDRDRLAEGIGHLQATLALRPEHMQGYSNLGNAYLRAGDALRAVAAYERGLTCPIDDPVVLGLLENNFGSARAQLGDMDDAIVHFRRAVEASPQIAEAHTNLGMALSPRGQTSEAMKHLETALRLNPGDQRARGLLDRLSRPDGASEPAASGSRD